MHNILLGRQTFRPIVRSKRRLISRHDRSIGLFRTRGLTTATPASSEGQPPELPPSSVRHGASNDNGSESLRNSSSKTFKISLKPSSPPSAPSSKTSSRVSTVSALEKPSRPPLPPPTTQNPSKPLDPSVLQLLPLLRAQQNHYISILLHGKRYLVTSGDTVRLPFLMPKVQLGDVLRLNVADYIGSRDFTLKGSPYLDENLFECRARVMGVESEPMRIKIKKKQRCRRTKHVKSKHKYTILRVMELVVKEPPVEA